MREKKEECVMRLGMRTVKYKCVLKKKKLRTEDCVYSGITYLSFVVHFYLQRTFD